MPAKKIILFYGTKDIYSQFHPAKFTIGSTTYNCAEQYMMHQKAILFEDYACADKIMKETDPGKIKKLGREVKNFNDHVWTKSCRSIVRKSNLEKFRQNAALLDELLRTGDSLIAEASPWDRRWGIGLKKDDKKALNPKTWQGTNWLGEAIMSAREELLRKPVNVNSTNSAESLDVLDDRKEVLTTSTDKK